MFLDDTHVPTPHANRPIGNSENMRRVEDHPVTIAPLTAEPGNVWPGPLPPTMTLEDLARQPMQPVPPLEPGTPEPDKSTVPNLVVPGVPGHLQPHIGDGGYLLNGPLSTISPPPTGAPDAGPPGLVQPPSKAGPIVVPNGDGTSTVIAPDGTITTIPTPPQ